MPSAAEKGGSGSPTTTTIQLARTPKKANPSTAAKLSGAENGGPGVFPGYDKRTRTHAEEGQAESSGEEGLGFLPRLVHEECESLTNTRRCRPDLNDDPSLCATLHTACGVGELYQRRSTLL
jgi:hypothetical protein